MSKIKIYLNDDRNKEEDCIVLYYDKWNDFGYITLFTVEYHDHKNEENKTIGEIKIAYQGMNLKDEYQNREVQDYLKETLINNEISLEGKNFISLGQSLNFYKNLKSVTKDAYKSVLIKLQDLTILEDLEDLEDFEDLEIMENSLLRFEEPNFIYKLSKFKIKLYQECELSEKITTYEFINEDMEKYFECIRTQSDLENFFLELAKINSYYYQFSKNVITYISKDVTSDKYEGTIATIKKNFIDDELFLKEINEILGENKGLLECISDIKRYLQINIDGEHLKLGHYTSMTTIEYLISDEEKYLRLTNSRQLNDPMEGKTLFEYLFHGEMSQEFVQSNIYISSATTELDSLPMWKQYTENVDGVSLQYSNSYLKKIINYNDINISKVCYFDINKNGEIEVEDDKIKELLKILKEEIDNSKQDKIEIMSLLNYISILFKKKEYAYENEYRIILDTNFKNQVNLLGDKNLTLFMDGENKKIILDKKSGFPIPFLYIYLNNDPLIYSEVMLGSKAVDIDYIAPYIKYCNKNIEISRSKINYR